MHLALTLFGLFAVAAMLLFYALEPRSTSYILAFAGACLLASTYGFLQGAWPFGLVEVVWSAVAVRRGTTQRRKRSGSGSPPIPSPTGKRGEYRW